MLRIQAMTMVKKSELISQHGWLILDKPLGITSAQAVARVKRILKPKKIGHGGTLDPLASGILPLALGEATKTFAYVVAHQKGYRFTIHFGESRSTDDAEGEITATSDVRPSREAIEAVLPLFLGEITQIPPIYSAVKIDGERAYARARAGEEIAMPPRQVRIDSLSVLECSGQEASFEVECGGGTYVRSLARDISQSLGAVGYVSALRRTRVGNFSEKHAISLDSLEEMVHGAAPFALLPIAQVLDDIPARTIAAAKVSDLRQGKTISSPHAASAQPPMRVLCLDESGTAIAIGEESDGLLKPVRVFQLD